MSSNFNDPFYAELVSWNFVSLTGRDRQRLLHSFCTANINRLATGKSTEAFILNEKGKTLWYGHVLSLPDRLLLCGASPIGEKIRAHLDRYIIREDVQALDQSETLQAFFISGSTSIQRVGELIHQHTGVPIAQLGQNEVISVKSSERSLTVAHLEIASWGILLIAANADAQWIKTWLAEGNVKACSPSALNAWRVEHFIPWYGADLDDSNLPQEVNRDDKAISFAKGCYLGQETVARIDALGHVNQILVGLRFPTPVEPEIGLTFERDGKKVGRVTSLAQDSAGWIGLGYVRREFTQPGTVLAYDGGEAIVR